MTKAKFLFARINLQPPFGGDMLPLERPPSMSRRQFLEKIFSSMREFRYEGETHYFLPSIVSFDSVGQYCILGKLGRNIHREEPGTAEVGFEMTTRIVGEFSWLLINCAEASIDGEFNELGQLAIFQGGAHYRHSAPKMLQKLIEAAVAEVANEDAAERGGIDWETPWEPRPQMILETKEFDEVYSRYHQEIRQINFIFDYPNAPKLSEDIKDIIRDLKEASNSKSIELTFAKDGRREFLDSKHIFELTDYMNDGGGKVFIRGPRRKYLYRSDKQEAPKTCSVALPPANDRSQEDDFQYQLIEDLLDEAGKKLRRD